MNFIEIIKSAGAAIEHTLLPMTAPGAEPLKINTGAPIGSPVPDILPGLEKAAGAVISNIEKIPGDFASGIVAGLSAEIKGLNLLTARDVTDLLQAAGFETGVGAVLADAPGLAYVVSSLVSRIADGITGGAYRDLEYGGNFRNPNKRIEVPDTIEAYHRGIITETGAITELSLYGYNAERAKLLLQLSRRLIGAGEIISAYHRGLYPDKIAFFAAFEAIGINDDDAQKMLVISDQLINAGEAITMWRRGIKVEGDKDAFSDLRRAGWTDARIEAIKESSHPIPNIFELQDFAVRQVDNEAIAAKFKLDAFADEKYFEGAAKLGYDRKTAQRFYRYYWNYPAFFILKDLYTSGKMSEEDFRNVLAFQRFTPYWIDRFAALLKPQLTQADIKDQYKYQIITGEQIVTELAKIGVTPELATQLSTLWQASVKLASPLDTTGAQAAAGKIKTDTASLINTAYKDKVITRDQALAHYKAINYSDDAAQLEIGVADYEINQTHIKAEFTIIKEDLIANVIDFTGAVTKLQALGITADQLDLYSSELNRAITHKPKMPTLAEFTAWYKKQIIDIQQYAQALSMLGYDNAWLPYYLMQAGASESDIAGLNLGSTALSK